VIIFNLPVSIKVLKSGSFVVIFEIAFVIANSLLLPLPLRDLLIVENG